MSILSREPDGLGFFYGFVRGDRRRVDVRYEAFSTDIREFAGFVAYVDGVAFQQIHSSIAEAECTAVDFIKSNPET